MGYPADDAVPYAPWHDTFREMDDIPDVAEVLVSVLERENTFKKVIKMRSGETPISSAIENI